MKTGLSKELCATIMRFALLGLFLWALGGGTLDVWAQAGTYQGGLGVTAASTQEQPLWIQGHEYGRIDSRSANGYVRFQLHGHTDTSRVWSVWAGGDLLGRLSETETIYFPELYTRFRYQGVQLRVGRQYETIGPVRGGDLSTGSLLQSRNATPLPMISLETAGYVNVPFTDGFAKVKGHYAHGWFGDDRFVRGAYLHRKGAYLRVGAGRIVSATMGLVHGAQWGGTAPPSQGGRLPQSREDYWSVVGAHEGREEAPEAEQVNVLGNHVGVYDFGSTIRLGSSAVSVYHQHLFEDGSGSEWKNFPDGLYGLRWSDSQWDFVSTVQYELLYTKNQSGSVRPPGRDDYYNNYLYRTGWATHRNLLGSPLFLFDPSRTDTNTVFSNRLVAHHFGIQGKPVASLRYRALATWMRHSGTYDYPFSAPRTQTAFLLEVTTMPFGAFPVEVNGAVAVDAGEALDDRVGVRLGIAYNGHL